MRKTIERVVFLQGDSADEALELYREKGIEELLSYLTQWHYPGEHETASEFWAGTSDDTYEFDGYVVTVNLGLNYCGLEYCEEGGSNE